MKTDFTKDAQQYPIACRVAVHLGARAIQPGQVISGSLLLVLHDIAHDAHMPARLFACHAAKCGRTVFVPRLDIDDWPVLQRPDKTARPKRGVLALLDKVAATDLRHRGTA